MSTALPFTGPALLAPMEGVTEPCFRDLVLARNPAAQLGGAFTEFARVAAYPLPVRTLKRHLGPHRFEAPVGLQLMGSDLGAVAESAARAVDAGAPLLDLNFGCPAKGALRGCAGSALLDDPPRVEELVAVCVEAVGGRVPVTAKIRAGGEDDRLLEELARAVESGGAALLTVHCRTRSEGYRPTADWARLRRAVAATSLPVCGNGGIERHADIARLLAETGCAYAMIGRAALGDPWIFSGREVDVREAARFLLEYADELEHRAGMAARGRAGRIKQLMQYWTAGGLQGDDRRSWLREREPARLFARLEAATEGEAAFPVPLRTGKA
ncbi:MAG: tRNA-dihydrouridine synthase family protein [Planctomycetota bacterium]